MKYRPILFTGAMVRAILDGRKTQTRRIVKDSAWVMDDCDAGYDGQTIGVPPYIDRTRCPYGQPGDRLWVRETWARINVALFTGEPQYVYPVCDTLTDYGGPWKPSIHMPRAASRITLEITSVRVERLQEISEADAKAEGIEGSAGEYWCPDHGPHHDAVSAYRELWGLINGPGAWAANPWVWVIEFRKVAA